MMREFTRVLFKNGQTKAYDLATEINAKKDLVTLAFDQDPKTAKVDLFYNHLVTITSLIDLATKENPEKVFNGLFVNNDGTIKAYNIDISIMYNDGSECPLKLQNIVSYNKGAYITEFTVYVSDRRNIFSAINYIIPNENIAAVTRIYVGDIKLMEKDPVEDQKTA